MRDSTVLSLCDCCATLPRSCLKAERRRRLNLKTQLLMVRASHQMILPLLMAGLRLLTVKVGLRVVRVTQNQQRSKVSLCEDIMS